MSLALCVVHLEHAFSHWYFDPARWRTVDGFAPWNVCWIQWRALQSVRAMDRLSLTRAVMLANNGNDAGHTARQDELRHAYPETDA